MMMGLKHLIDIYSVKGREFIEKLFSTYVTVNEKMDGSAFVMEKNPRTGRLEYFKKSSIKPIDKIDRILAKYYEPAIRHFDSLDFGVRSKIQPGWSFGFEYFVDNKPVEIEYDEVPENHLMLSYIHIKDNEGKVVKTIQDKKDLDNWARVLKVSPPPIIFQGIINADQKVQILQFLDTPFNELVDKFKTQSFVEYIVGILNPSMTRTSLNKDLTRPIEGTVFRFGGLEEDENVFSAKLVDPVFTQLAREKAKTKISKKPNDTYNLTVLEMMNFIDMLNLRKFVPIGRTFEDRYIAFICSVFNSFVKEDGDQYKDLDFDVPEYMKKDYFGIGSDFIPNLETRRLIYENPGFEQLFKIMLAVFRKKKKKTSPLFTKELVLKFNATVDNIYKHLTTSKIEEGELPTFGDFHGGDFKIEEEEDEEEKEDFIFSKEEEKPKLGAPLLKRGGKRVNIIVGRFQPFHNGHLKMAEILHKKNRLPVVLVIVHPGHNKSGKSPFDKSLMSTLVSGLAMDSNGIIIGHIFTKDGFIENILDVLRPKYEPVAWGSGEDRIPGYLKQLELNTKKGNPLNLEDIDVVKTPRGFSGTEARQAIENDDFADFARLVPKSIQVQWMVLKNNISESFKLNEHMNNDISGYFSGKEVFGPAKESISEIHFRIASLVNSTDDAVKVRELYLDVERKAKALPYYRKIDEAIKGKINESITDNNFSSGDFVMPKDYPIQKRYDVANAFEHFLMQQNFSLGEMEILSSSIRTVKLPKEILEGKGLYTLNWDNLLSKKMDPISLGKFLKYELAGQSEGKGELPIALLFENGYLVKDGDNGDIMINEEKYEVKSGKYCKLGGMIGFKDGSLEDLRKEIQDRTDFDILEGIDLKLYDETDEEKKRVKSLRTSFNIKSRDNRWPGMIPRIKNKAGLVEALVNYFCERWKSIRKYPHLVKEMKTFFEEWVITGRHRDGLYPLALTQARYYQLVEGFRGIISVKKGESHTIFINPEKITIDEFRSAVKVGSINWDRKMIEFSQR